MKNEEVQVHQISLVYIHFHILAKGFFIFPAVFLSETQMLKQHILLQL